MLALAATLGLATLQPAYAQTPVKCTKCNKECTKQCAKECAKHKGDCSKCEKGCSKTTTKA